VTYRVLAVILGVIGISTGAAPTVLWWSAPLAPGQTVLVHGGDWGEAPAVEMVALPNGRPGRPREAGPATFRRPLRVNPLTVTDTGISFVYPAALRKGLVACRIKAVDRAVSQPFVLNEPAPWWIQGDWGEEASPGGWLRIQGRCLQLGETPRIVLVSDTGNREELKLSRFDSWSLEAAIQPDTPEGVFEVFTHNGCGGNQGWRSAGHVHITSHAEVWKTDTFDVTAYGATPSDGLDDSEALRAALQAATDNGGGIVYLPRGRFQCNEMLHIPPHTLLRGQSREASQLYWPDAINPPEALIEGSHSFGITDLFIHSGAYRNGIVCRKPEAGAPEAETASNVTLQRLRLKLVVDQYILKNTDEYERRSYMRGNGIVISGGKFVRVEDCDITASKEGSTTLFFVLNAAYLQVARCRISGSGWAIVGGNRVIFEDNEATNCTYSIHAETNNLYWGRNRQYAVFTNNRESITNDGSRTAFADPVKGVSAGTDVTLGGEGKEVQYRYGREFWLGKSLQLVQGRGAGQLRTIAALADNRVTIDRPWDIAPDASSLFMVKATRRRHLYIDNYTEDSTIAIQLYGGLVEGILAGNRCARAGGFLGFGMKYWGVIPLWFMQFLDNEILEGNGYRGPQNELPPRDAVMALQDRGRGLDLTRSCVIRGAILHNNAHVFMESANGVVDDCVVRNASRGIVVGPRYAESTVLRGNRFEEVALPLNKVALLRAKLHPAERVLAMLSGTRTRLGDRTPRSWTAIEARLRESLQSTEVDGDSAASDAQACLLQAIRSLSVNGSSVLPEGTLNALLGTHASFPNWDGNLVKLCGTDDRIQVKAPLSVSLSPVAPPGHPVHARSGLTSGLGVQQRATGPGARRKSPDANHNLCSPRPKGLLPPQRDTDAHRPRLAAG
jgi:hypothetical protein